MTNLDWLAALLMGLFGSLHCLGMCGGVASGVSLASARMQHSWRFSFYYNVGRLTSYVMIGLLAGLMGAFVGHNIQNDVDWIRLLAGVLVISMGLYLISINNFLLIIERVGHKLWRFVQPLSTKVLPVNNIWQACILGLLWGWLPCGLVYTALSLALTQSEWWSGGLVMLAFGVGTLPSMIGVGVLADRILQWKRNKRLRTLAALILVSYGVVLCINSISTHHHHH